MEMLMTNLEIYETALSLKENFGEEAILGLPVLVNYTIQKNLKNLLALSSTIESVKEDIGKKYGKRESEGIYKIPPENLEKAQADLTKLMTAKELINIKKITLKDMEGIKISNKQMAALLFMIEEE